MAEIPLCNRAGEVVAWTLLDDEDYERFGGQHWSRQATGYPQGWDGTHVRTLHRMILNLAVGDPRHVDHISGDKLDNRRANLRVCNRSLNQRNLRGAKSHSATGILHVTPHQRGYAVYVHGYVGVTRDLDKAIEMAIRARCERYEESETEARLHIFPSEA